MRKNIIIVHILICILQLLCHAGCYVFATVIELPCYWYLNVCCNYCIIIHCF